MKRTFFIVRHAVTVCCLSLVNVSVTAQSWIEQHVSQFKGVVAAGVSIDSLPYEATDDEVDPSLVIMGSTGDLFFEGNRLGYTVNRSDVGALSIVGQQRTHQYIPDDTSLTERDKAIEMGIQLAKPISTQWTAQVTVLADVSDTHQGQEVELGVYRRFAWEDFRLLTLIALQKQSDKLTHYYAGTEQYEAEGDLNAEIELIGVYEFTEKWNATVVYRHYFHGSEFDDSPITNDNQTQKLFLGLGYSF